jgi:GrpB-like predicted nucleotidyltransferase (UPF0157 family)
MSALTIVEYQPHWPALFREVSVQLETAFAPAVVHVEHIGSTSVHGLCAKPVIDILLGADSLVQIESGVQALSAAGFFYRPEYESELPERRYFVRPAAALPRIHLHGVVRGGHLWRQHLIFRDALRANRALAQEYAELKRKLAARHSHDKAAYTMAKAPFVLKVIADHMPTNGKAAPSAA